MAGDYPSSSSVTVKNGCSNTYVPLYAFIGHTERKLPFNVYHVTAGCLQYAVSKQRGVQLQRGISRAKTSTKIRDVPHFLSGRNDFYAIITYNKKKSPQCLQSQCKPITCCNVTTFRILPTACICLFDYRNKLRAFPSTVCLQSSVIWFVTSYLS